MILILRKDKNEPLADGDWQTLAENLGRGKLQRSVQTWKRYLMRSGWPFHRFTTQARVHPTLTLQIKTEGLQHFNLWVPALLSAYLNLPQLGAALRQICDIQVAEAGRKRV